MLYLLCSKYFTLFSRLCLMQVIARCVSSLSFPDMNQNISVPSMRSAYFFSSKLATHVVNGVKLRLLSFWASHQVFSANRNSFAAKGGKGGRFKVTLSELHLRALSCLCWDFSTLQTKDVLEVCILEILLTTRVDDVFSFEYPVE